MTEDLSKLLSCLDEQQKKAVLINNGSLLIFAGAGSGKTRVITTKIAYLIMNALARPEEILAVTFTNKACNEMRTRVAEFVGEELASRCMIRTFHSFGVWLLRRYGDRVGLAPNFTIYDDRESASLLHQCFPAYSRKDLDSYAKKISALKDRMAKPSPHDTKLCEFYEAYNRKLRETGNVDFADMILKSNELLENHADVRERIRNRFKVILVDEYQDSNTAQFNMLRLLTGPRTFVCVVGDDDQSIYRFRGAEVKNILNFSKQFENTQTVVLGTNYRCTEPILAVARDVIGNNVKRVDKNLVADKNGGTKPTLYYVNTEFDEAQLVVDAVKTMTAEQRNSTAVLYRTNAQSKAFEDRFIINSIAYRIVGSLKFYDREEVKDAIAMISLMVNPLDSVAFERMVNKPSRGIGASTIRKITDHGSNMIRSSEELVRDGLIKGKAARGLEVFTAAYNKCSSRLGKLDNGELMHLILTEFGILYYYKNRDFEENNIDSLRVDSLNQLVSMLSDTAFCDGIEGLYAFLEYAALDPSSLGGNSNSQNGGVTLITMHNTKGLEFDNVFVTGLEDGIFPSIRDGENEDDLEEERRICYVAMTRARKNLYLSCASTRMVWGRMNRQFPSRFLDEIDKNHINVVDKRALWKTFAVYDSSRKYPYLNPVSDSYDDWKQDLIPFAEKKKLPERQIIRDWKTGDRVKNDIMGEGTVTELKKFGSRVVLVVKFDDGRTGSYIPDKADFIRTGHIEL